MIQLPRWHRLSPGLWELVNREVAGAGCSVVVGSSSCSVTSARPGQVPARAAHVCGRKLSHVSSVCSSCVTRFPRPLDGLATKGKKAGENFWVGFFLCFS